MTPAALRDIAIDRAEQDYREALAESSAICARAIDAAEDARRDCDRMATNERRLAVSQAHDAFNMAMEGAA